jgi:hypothetical protein
MHTIGESILRCIGWLVLAGLLVHDAGLVPDCLAGKSDMQLVHLYFADAKRPFLIAESRDGRSRRSDGFCRQLVLELINGSARGNLATIPEGTKLRSFFLLGDGTAVVDFSTHLKKITPGVADWNS